jgi:hypothetical protein
MEVASLLRRGRTVYEIDSVPYAGDQRSQGRDTASVLSWDKPKKAMSREEWEAISADSAPPGVYTPNMSKEDARRWRAKKIGGANPRVEIRKTVSGDDPLDVRENPRWRHGCHAQLLIVVMADGRVRMSQNGPAIYSAQDWADLELAIAEARKAMEPEGEQE